MFKCKVFGLNCPKTLHLPLERPSAPAEIRIVTMAEFHKNGSKEPFLWNCAATAARINRFAVYSVDIIVQEKGGSVHRFPGFFCKKGRPARNIPDRPPGGTTGSHDVFLGAVVRHPDAHLLQRGHREIGDAHRVKFGTQPQLRTEPKVLHRVSEFRFFQSDHPRNSMPRRRRDMGGIIRGNGGTLEGERRTRREGERGAVLP